MKKRAKPKFYSVTQAAESLGVTRQAVHLAIKKGTLKARKVEVVKTEWQITSASIDAYKVSNARQTAGKKNELT